VKLQNNRWDASGGVITIAKPQLRLHYWPGFRPGTSDIGVR
jgi:hypothetical protein